MSELQKAIDKLVSRETGWKVFLKDRAPAQPIGASIGVGKPVASKAGGGGGDLTETSFAARTYYPDKYITTSDGIFTFQALKSCTFTDASGATIKITFAPPP